MKRRAETNQHIDFDWKLAWLGNPSPLSTCRKIQNWKCEMIANLLVSMNVAQNFFFFVFAFCQTAKLPEDKLVTGNLRIRMFFMSICGYSCCSLWLPALPSSQAQRNKAKHSRSPMRLLLVSVAIHNPSCVSDQFGLEWPSACLQLYLMTWCFCSLSFCPYVQLNMSVTVLAAAVS